MKIVFFDSNSQEEQILREFFPQDELRIYGDSLSLSHLPDISDAEVVSVFVRSKIGADMIEAMPKLRLIATRSTGFDHIDLVAAKARGVRVAFVPGYGDNAVAEYTFALMLAMTRRIYEGIARVRASNSFSLENLRGTDLMGKTLGIIGTGRIGREVAKLAKAFGMKIALYDPCPNQQFADSLGASYSDLTGLLGKSDIVSLHCPYMPATHHLLNAENIPLMKSGGLLINTSRGAVIETDALVLALRQGKIGGAALDVLEEEGQMNEEMRLLTDGHPNESELRILLEDHILMKMPNVYITPHNAFNTSEALRRILDVTVRNIRSFQAGEVFQEVVVP